MQWLTLTWILAFAVGLRAADETNLRSAKSSSGNAALPWEAQGAISTALGKDQAAYHVRPIAREEPAGKPGAFQAANPNQHLTARFDAQGAWIASENVQWNLGLRAWGYGDTWSAEFSAGNDLPGASQNAAIAPVASANRVEYRRGALTEWYVNGPMGLQQGFTVNAPPARNAMHSVAGGPLRRGSDNTLLTLVLNLPAAGVRPQLDADQTGLTLLNAQGEAILRYRGLTAWDADGRRLAARLEIRATPKASPGYARSHDLLLRVDDSGARYPIAIDPFVQQAKLTISDGATNDLFGCSVALSADGNTALVGALQADVGAVAQQGAVYVFIRSGAVWSQQAKFTAADGNSDDCFGSAVALSSDGNTAIASSKFADVGGNGNQGAAYIFTRTGAAWNQQAKLTAADGTNNDFFGNAVALSGDGNTAIAGAYQADVGGNANQGAAYIFTRSGAAWSQQMKLTVADGAEGDKFGNAVALNSDGNTAIAGAIWGSDVEEGAAYVFTRSGIAWSQQAKLVAADRAANDNFGNAVALNGDGNTALIGAPFVDVGGNANQGAAYIFTRSGVVWSQQAKLTAADGAATNNFGWAVALSSNGNTAIAGANYAGVNGNEMQGTAYAFTRSGVVWSQQSKLTAADGAISNQFGFGVALSSDGNTSLAGAPHADVCGNARQGAAYVFTRSGTTWSQQAKLVSVYGVAYDYFGRAVALSADGNTAIAGAYKVDVIGHLNQGAAYIFSRSGTAWSQQAKLVAADGAADDYFGFAVSLSSDGNTALVGAYQAAVGANTNQGAAYVFTRSDTAWSEQAKLVAADGAANDYFGRAVALNSDGSTALAGAQQADMGTKTNQGAAYVFTRSGSSWTEQAKLTATDGSTNDYFGVSVDLSDDGNTAIAGAYYANVGWDANQGAAYVFTRAGAAWSQQAQLTATDGLANDNFGVGVALSGDGNTAIAGAYLANVGANVDQGAAYVFARAGAAWSRQAKLTATAGAATDLLGFSVALSSNGNSALVGAYGADVGGAAYVFTRTGTNWSEQQKLTAADGAASDCFGISVDLSGDGNTALAGAYQADVGGIDNAGAVYVLAVSTLQFAESAYSVSEDAGSVTLTVTRLGTSGVASVTFNTTDGTASAGTDYTATTGTLAWADGNSDNQTISIPILKRFNLQASRAFTVSLSGAAGASLGSPASAAVTITESGVSPVPPAGVSASDGRYSDQVRLTWNSAADAAGYQIWRHTADDSSAAALIGTSVQTNYADTGAAGGQIYFYWVKATNAHGASAFSASDSGWRRSVGYSHYADMDIDGDRKADLVIFDPVTGTWSARLSAFDYALVSGIFGDAACTLVPGDYDGDRLTDPGIYAELIGLWTVMLSSLNYAQASATLGGMGHAPVPGDFDGDRKTDPGVYEAASGEWQVLLSASGYAEAGTIFGGSDYLPVQRDYDGDLKYDPAIYHLADGTWRAMLSGSGYGVASATGFGGTGYAPVVGDYDGDGKADPALYHEATGLWTAMLSGSGYLIATGTLGGTGYAALPGDYDGDGKTDPGVYNRTTGEWYVMLSGSGYGIATTTFGGEGYDPVGFRPVHNHDQ